MTIALVFQAVVRKLSTCRSSQVPPEIKRARMMGRNVSLSLFPTGTRKQALVLQQMCQRPTVLWYSDRSCTSFCKTWTQKQVDPTGVILNWTTWCNIVGEWFETWRDTKNKRGSKAWGNWVICRRKERWMDQGEDEKGQKDSAQWNPLLFTQKVVIINNYINYHLKTYWYSCDINRAERNATSIRNIHELNLDLHVTTRK